MANTIPRNREAWQAVAVGCHWTYAGYSVSTVNGPTLGTGYLCVYNREEVEPGQTWPTFEEAADAAGRHARRRVQTIPLPPFRIPGRNGSFRRGYAEITWDSVAIYHQPKKAGKEAIPVLVLENSADLRLAFARLLEMASA